MVAARRLAVLVALALVAASCHGSREPSDALRDGAITVGSFDFPESELLGELYAQVLEGAGFHVVRQFDLGPRELVMPSLERGLLEVVPEYAGSALTFVGGTAVPDAAETHRLLAAAVASRGLDALDPAPAMDRNGFAVTIGTAARLNATSLDDLEAHASSLVFAGPPECEERDLCLKGLEDVYGLRFKDVLRVDTGGPLTVAALNAGTADVGLLFTSDPILNGGRFVLLRDDRGLEPAENVTPIAHDEVAQRFGSGPAEALDRLSAVLTTSALRDMNGSVEGGRDPSEVAAAWLASNLPSESG
jgi:osmoprotectant transport system substrate-binding protein